MPDSPAARRLAPHSGDPRAPDSSPRVLRQGFTTGTAAAAAARAALRLLLQERGLPEGRDPRSLPESGPIEPTPLPPFADNGEPAAWLDVPVAEARILGSHAAEAVVIKDGGDDPDATHGARIVARIELAVMTDMADLEDPAKLTDTAEAAPGPQPLRPPLLLAPTLMLIAGEGIGTVTLPGLPVAVGEPAINPVPRRQIAEALAALAREYGCRDGYCGSARNSIRLTLSVPGGEAMARNTFNPRLGITGGISILGTHGTVKPFSHDAWKATIEEGLAVARATGCEFIALSTGRRSERLLQGLYPALPPQAFIQAADFAAFSLAAASQTGFTRLAWGCFFGKLLKLAQGLEYTHARTGTLDLSRLAAWCVEAGLDEAEVAPLADCTTAGQALELLLARPDAAKTLLFLAAKAKTQAERFAHGASVTLHLFHLDGRELARV